MTKESYALLTGLFVIILGATLVAIGTFLGNYGVVRDVYTVVTTGSVSGLNPEATVIYRGVPAGKVTAIDFDPQDVRNILVRIEINRGLPITKGTYAMLRIQGLTGLAQVELDDKGENPEALVTHPEQPARIPLRPSLIDKLTASGEALLPKLTRLADQFNGLVGEDNRSRVRAILAHAELAAKDLVELEKRTQQTLAEFPVLSQRTAQTLNEISHLTEDFQVTSQHVRAAADATQGFAHAGKSTADALQTTAKTLQPQLEKLLADLQRATAQIRRLTAVMEDDPQALLLGPPPPPPGPGEPGYQEVQ